LPTIKFSVEGFRVGEIVNITLKGSNYMQGDGNGYTYFAVQPSNDNVIFGAVVHNVFYIVMDRENQKVGFGPGCDCET
jgi:hypothetical protein